MTNVGKCPGCGNIVRSANVENISISAGIGGATWRGASYVCPNASCRTVLGVQIDPVALKTDIVKEIGRLIKGK